jgi:hypothetical protein
MNFLFQFVEREGKIEEKKRVESVWPFCRLNKFSYCGITVENLGGWIKQKANDSQMLGGNDHCLLLLATQNDVRLILAHLRCRSMGII